MFVLAVVLWALSLTPAAHARALAILRQDRHLDTYDVAWYSAGTQPPARVVGSAPVCGDNTVSCRSTAMARSDTCAQLLDYLSAKASTPAPRDSVSVCLTDHTHADNNQCCVAWTDYVEGLVLGFLLNAGAKTWGQCRASEGLVGGISSDVILGGKCQSQCLGNSPICST